MGPAATVRRTKVAGEAVRVCEWRKGAPTKSKNRTRRAAEDRHTMATPGFPLARNFGILITHQCSPRCGCDMGLLRTGTSFGAS
jgi:hypothetical protein